MKIKNTTRKDIEKYKQRLKEALNESAQEKRRNILEELAKELGASTTRMVEGPLEETDGSIRKRDEWLKSKTQSTHPGRVSMSRAKNKITETEIVENINAALQIAMMLDMCNNASRNFYIAFFASVAATVSAIAAWYAVLGADEAWYFCH